MPTVPSFRKMKHNPDLLKNLPADFLAGHDKLSREQAGHLRHFHNLATQRDGEWGVMGSQDPGQEWLDAYRYQLATMAYAAGAAHFHRLPALRSIFQSLLSGLIHKMLRREVWGYWFLTSHSGKFVDPDIKRLRQPWADPVVKENIMYSGHLLLMVSLYTMLFNDDKYNQEGALTFNWSPIFWGMGPEKFSYTRESLQKAILAEMEREKWLGVCCEPNCIFIVCNQFPIIALRYNDVRDGTNVATEVLSKYTAAWEAKGMAGPNGLFISWYSPKQDTKRPALDLGFTAWATAFMNAWNPILANETFQAQSIGFLTRADHDRISINRGPVAFAIRELAEKKGVDPYSLSTMQKARDIVASNPTTGEHREPFPRPMFGYILMAMSELGDESKLAGLLNHVDRFFQPTWQNGGLYYPVNAEQYDKDGNWTEVEPFTGNGAVGYARLTVLGGQRKMWEEPWSAEQVSRAPHISGIDLGSGVDFLRGCWDESHQAMVVTMRTWDQTEKFVRLENHNLPVGTYGVYRNGVLTETKFVDRPGDTLEVYVRVEGIDFDLVLLKA
ncbi:hypothetical protein BDV35DRAFT_337542 [Aspergillus flavus]|uniref:Linalool dehydratase/isomerase domain-containing protein n=2 Tax=Aspergillus subgen. Circumdati TaxID=2720871 RepID=A0A5N6HBN7_ASPFL|nr:hypothetical protein Ao3042_10706 [Aspergillus oryzae 3.042]KAB8251906.1 hypothetical protein BDV35DRAFT_337542 [Aspergillus flavus]KDE78231.1 hypothetical protein AO1008_04446 [Aspergillus oryzae 100-8]|eukprot:EIT73383.1 hypothetical protein Ao3042_10706 [Aspergillus oryzae 3.042]